MTVHKKLIGLLNYDYSPNEAQPYGEYKQYRPKYVVIVFVPFISYYYCLYFYCLFLRHFHSSPTYFFCSYCLRSSVKETYNDAMISSHFPLTELSNEDSR